MARPRAGISLKELERLAYEYIDECIENTRQHPTASGNLVTLKDRHIPTIDYFLRIWIVNQGSATINRSTYYDWLKSDNVIKSNTMDKIEGVFKALATDIVANEGKGIFYAKNRLGMSDKIATEIKSDIQPLTIIMK